jgi:hypothetical protein
MRSSVLSVWIAAVVTPDEIGEHLFRATPRHGSGPVDASFGNQPRQAGQQALRESTGQNRRRSGTLNAHEHSPSGASGVPAGRTQGVGKDRSAVRSSCWRLGYGARAYRASTGTDMAGLGRSCWGGGGCQVWGWRAWWAASMRVIATPAWTQVSKVSVSSWRIRALSTMTVTDPGRERRLRTRTGCALTPYGLDVLVSHLLTAA